MLHYLHLFVRPKVENPWLLDGAKLTTLARCLTKVVMFASREIEFESQHVCAWFCFVPLHHWCISTVWHLVLLSLCKALNFITTSSCRNNILVLRIEKRRKKEEHNTWTFSYVHFYMHISRKLYVNFCMCLCFYFCPWPHFCATLYLPVKSVEAFYVPISVSNCFPILVWPFTFTEKSECYPQDITCALCN